MRLDDLKYYIDGEEATYLQWKEWKSYHVPEWLKIKYKQTELLRSLKKLHGHYYQ